MKVEDRKSPLISGAELLGMKFDPEKWVVADLLRIDSKRMSMLLGQPRDGKSTLAWQLAAAVTSGQPFLGRKTLRSPVLFWQVEAESRKVAASLRRLGYDPARDEKLLVLNSSTTGSNLKALRRELEEHPGVQLVIIETLDDLLRIQDLNKNSAARESFEKFDNLIMNDFSSRCAFLALHHLNKKECDRQDAMNMGATVISGKTDNLLYIRRKSDDDPRRVFNTKLRSGVEIPLTYLDYDAETETSTLGLTLADERRMNIDKTGERVKAAILNFFRTHPDTPFEKDCLPYIQGNGDLKRRMFKQLVADGFLVRTGKGTKTSPHLYHAEIPTIPVEEAA
jgi:hypothetical protein